MEINLDDRMRTLMQLMGSPFARMHFSQMGEDCLLWHYFHSRRDGFYVDVGCHDPFRYSNTYLLHRVLNWRGINIDADPRAIAKFRDARPSDINLNVGIGAAAESREFTMFCDGAVNTFDVAIASKQAEKFPVAGSAPIQIRPLADVLEEHVPPGTTINYLNVDCEGLDHEAVISNDWSRFRPDLVSVEIHDLMLDEAGSNQTVRFLKDQGYAMRSHYICTTFFERRR